jgi:hypothetical protein
MNCRFCNVENPKDAAFCKNCGSRIAEEVETEAASDSASAKHSDTAAVSTPKKKKSKKAFWIVAAIILGLILISNAGKGANSSPSNNAVVSAGDQSPSDSSLSDTSSETTPTEEAPLAPSDEMFDEGTWLVGQDIKPGTYRPATAIESECYWEIDKAGTNGSDIIANDNAKGGFPILTLKVGQEVTNDGCGTFVKIDLATVTGQHLTSFGDGTWMVGLDIKAGNYKTTSNVSGMSCYWEIDSANSNQQNIIANDNVSGGFARVTLKNGQIVSSGDCGTFKQ